MKLSLMPVWFSMLFACGAERAPEEVGEHVLQELPTAAAVRVIDGGVSAASDNFALLIRDPDPETGIQCTAVLVAPRVVLTARHCVSTIERNAAPKCEFGGTRDRAFNSGFPKAKKDPSVLRLYVGDRFSKLEEQAIRVQSIDVDDSMDGTCWQDFAVLTLDAALEGVPTVPVRKTAPQLGERLRVVGFGAVDDVGTFVDARRTRGDVEFLGLGPMLVDGFVAPEGAVVTTTGFCHGDSGGPLLDAQGALVGLVSRTAGPCTTSKNMYTGMKFVAPVLESALQRLSLPPDAGAGDGSDAGTLGAPASPPDSASACSAGAAANTCAPAWGLAGVVALFLVTTRGKKHR